MVQVEILLSLVLAVAGVCLLVGVVRESARRGRGPGGVRAELATTTGVLPDGGAAPAVPREAADPAAGVVAIGAAPAAPAHRPAGAGADEGASALPATPLPTPDLPVRSARTPAPPAPGLSNGVRNSRFARYDRSGRPAAMGSPYLR